MNNKDRNFTHRSLEKFIEEADERLSDYMKRLDERDADEDSAGGDGSGSGRGDSKLAESPQPSGTSETGTRRCRKRRIGSVANFPVILVWNE
ncbi:hypothetical protein [Labrys neptuniae]